MTLSNVNKTNENDFFQLNFEMKNFIKNESDTLLSCFVNFKFDKVMIPRGFYAKMICRMLNICLKSV